MLDKLSAALRHHEMLQADDTVICAVSGGADSMALLFALYLLQDKLQFQVQAAHFNHNLRGAESDADQAFVQEFCSRYDIPLHLGSGKVIAGEKGLEAAARDARYRFFQGLSGKIATAHTANDNAETVLMRLVRGTGLKGLGAIAPVRGNIIRPLLNVTRGEILSFLEEYHIPYRQDSSNNTDDFLRNRLRHHVMPLLLQENPKLAENLSAMALRLRQDEQALSAMARPEDDVAVLRAMSAALRSRCLELFLKQSGVREPEAQHIALAEALVFSHDPSAQGHFPNNITIGRRYGRLVPETEQPPFQPVSLPCPGSVQLGSLLICCQAAEEIINTADTVTVRPSGQMILRPRQTGDCITLSGGTKSLKKLFIDRKIPAAQRNQVPVLADEQGILAVYGIGADKNRQTTELPAWQIRFIPQKQRG